jgi:hypothetical protein
MIIEEIFEKEELEYVRVFSGSKSLDSQGIIV